jgi:hypothetical protein
VTPDTETIRIAYIAWVRRATASGACLFVLIAAEQLAVRNGFWNAPGGGDALRYLFWAVAVAGVFVGRNLRQRGPVAGSDSLAASRSLSWKLVTLSLAPAPVGFVLSFMTRSPLDFLAMLLVSLVAFAILFPPYRQWLAWNASAETADESDPS